MPVKHLKHRLLFLILSILFGILINTYAKVGEKNLKRRKILSTTSEQCKVQIYGMF